MASELTGPVTPALGGSLTAPSASGLPWQGQLPPMEEPEAGIPVGAVHRGHQAVPVAGHRSGTRGNGAERPGFPLCETLVHRHVDDLHRDPTAKNGPIRADRIAGVGPVGRTA